MTWSEGTMRGSSSAIPTRRAHPTLLVIAVTIVLAASGLAAELSPDLVRAAGMDTATVTIDRLGRYAIQVGEGPGVALRLVDRMAGPGPWNGTAGEHNGRIDVILDEGAYRVETRGATEATGTARLRLEPFVERNTTPIGLDDHRRELVQLRDLEQRSWWLQTDARTTVVIRAAGRALHDLRLWRDGNWLLDATPSAQRIEPTTGRPLRQLRLVATLEPGTYRLCAYGGPALPWASGGSEMPLIVERGVHTRPVATRTHHEIGPFGADEWLIPAPASFVRLELPETARASLEAHPYDPDTPRLATGAVARIEVDSRRPVAELEVSAAGEPFTRVVVRGTPGQPYSLQHFEANDLYRFNRSGRWWISTVSSGDHRDWIDATAVLLRTVPGSRQLESTPWRTVAIRVGPDRGWVRRCTLAEEPSSVFVEIAEDGVYTPLAEDVEASFQIQPFLLEPPPRYEPPEFRPARESWQLQAGLYLLSVRARTSGAATVALLHGPAQSHPETPSAETPPRLAEAQLGAVELDARRWYTLAIPPRPGVRTGALLRELPLDPARSLPVRLEPNDPVTISIRCDRPGSLSATLPSGTNVELAVGDAPWSTDPLPLSSGRHEVTLRSDAQQTVVANLELVPQALTRGALPFPVPEQDPTLDSPLLRPAAPLFIDLARDQTAVFAVEADEPALYTITSSGLLATSGTLRSRTSAELESDSGSGAGRNFLLATYLVAGSFQLQVRTLGDSAGRAGLHVDRSPLADGGVLVPGAPARLQLAPQQSVAYRFSLDAPETVRVRALGPDGPVRCRLEDTDGWPLVQPGVPADLTLDLAAGAYRLIILPSPVGHRCVSTLEILEPPAEREGHGPHLLPLNTAAEHIWTEPEEGEERLPDVWQLEVPAPVHGTVSLSPGMSGRLVHPDGESYQVAPVRGWSGSIQAGSWRLELRAVLPNNRLPYTVELATEELVAGASRAVRAPASVPLSVGTAPLTRIWSSGDHDVRARLLDTDGRSIAERDDVPGDWNFELARSLDAGRYTLEVVPVDRDEATTTLLMSAPEPISTPAMQAPEERAVDIHDAVVAIPLELTGREDALLVVEVTSEHDAGFALQRTVPSGLQTLASASSSRPPMAVPVDPSTGPYTLLVWPEDRRARTVRIAVRTARPTPFTEADLERGVGLAPIAHADSTFVAKVTFDRPGCFDLIDPPDGLRISSAAGVPAQPPALSTIVVDDTILWLVGDVTGSVRAHRRTLSLQRPSARLHLRPDQIALCDLDGRNEGPQLITAESQASRPAVALSAGPEIPTAAIIPGREAAVALATGGATTARVWASETIADARVTVAVPSWTVTRSLSAEPGIHRLTLEPKSRYVATLPDRPALIRVAIGVGGLVGAVDNGRIHATVWAQDREEVLERSMQASGQLLLLNPSDTEVLAEIETVPGGRDMPPPTLTSSQPLERRSARPASWTVPITLDSDGLHELRSSGISELRFVGSDGQLTVTTGDPISVGSDGTATVRTDSGIVQLWLDPPGQPGAGLWGDPGSAEPIVVTPPAAVELEGPTTTLVVPVSDPTLLHLRGSEPVVARVVRREGREEVTRHPQGLSLDLFSKDQITVHLRAIARTAVQDLLYVTTATPAIIGDGPGPEQLLGPGSATAFAIQVDHPTTVGVGLRSTGGTVTASLLDGDGQTLATGPAQMVELEPGRYTLVVTTPSYAEPAVIQPVVVGLERPETGPPEEALRSYLKGDAR